MKNTLSFCLFLAVMAFGQSPRPVGAPATELPHFLTLPVKVCEVSEGWHYDKEVEVHPKIPTHFAVDCRAKRGTPVHAAADGWAISSFQTFILPDKWQGKPAGFGLGNFVQVCAEGICQVYAHMERVAESVPYFPPDEHDGLYNPSVVNRPFGRLLEKGEVVNGKLLKPTFVWQGQIIGWVGDSGLSWGYSEKPREKRDHGKLRSWDMTHLHFEVYSRNERGFKALRWDPFGLYDKADAYKSGRQGPHGLFIEDRNGKPVFVKVR